MKKLLALLLITVLCACCFASCDMLGKNEGLTYDEYENCAVFSLDGFEGKTTVKLKRTLLGEGAIYYLADLEEGTLSVKYEYAGVHVLAELSQDDAMPNVGSGGSVMGDEIAVSLESQSSVSGEIIIAFTEEALIAVRGELKLHEHTFVFETNDDAHKLIYTCDCDWLDEKSFEPHYDEDNNGCCDACERAYTVTPPPNPAADCLCDQKGLEWLRDISAQSVVRVKTVKEYVGVRPGLFKEIESTENAEVILSMLDDFIHLEVVPIAKEEGEMDGGESFTVRFTLATGDVKEIYINNENYCDGENYYRLSYVPQIRNRVLPQAAEIVDSYAFVTYSDYCTVFDGKTKICEILMNEIEFVEAAVAGDDFSHPKYVIKTDFGNLIFYTDDIFSIEEGTENFYRLVGKNLAELMIAYATNE